MAEFIRARSDEQKAQRLEEIKAAAKRQFAERPYHEITLTTVADELGWSRANLYKYVGTKEEIFLLITGDECKSYFNALLGALPEGCGLDRGTVAEVWGGIANAHRDYFRLGDLLSTIIETNVTVERLAEFKQGYYEQVDAMTDRLPKVLGIAPENVEPLLLAVYYHATGFVSGCWENPLIAKALETIGRPRANVNFRTEMRSFIDMCIARLTAGPWIDGRPVDGQ